MPIGDQSERAIALLNDDRFQQASSAGLSIHLNYTDLKLIGPIAMDLKVTSLELSRSAIVVSGHKQASIAGVSILRKGGSVADALIATSATLAVTLGHATSLGGDCFCLFHDAASARTYALNGSGTAPELATASLFSDGIDVVGARASIVPSLVRSWGELHRRFGRLPWNALFDNAIEVASSHTASRVLCQQAARYRDRIAGDQGCSELFLPGGRPIEPGMTLRQPALAKTLQAIATSGPESFYEGDISKSISAFFEERHGLIRATDLESYRPFWTDPVSTRYRDYRVMVAPPNSCGALLLMQLNGLSALPSTTLKAATPERIGYQISAMRASIEHGAHHIADPGTSPSISELLGPKMISIMQDSVLRKALHPASPDQIGTACALVADVDGNAACLVQSVFNVFGSAVLDPSTGILFNNRLQGFVARPGRPNSIGPKKRPAHTLCPVMVLRYGRPRYVLASPGGISQTIINAQVITNLIDGWMPVDGAVRAPRWCTTASGEILIEPEFPPDFVPRLAESGYEARQAHDDFFFGSAKAIEILPTGFLLGSGDQRREAIAIGC
jgi:gamma-glutamyltranspeptidase/glutathione hydrolase